MSTRASARAPGTKITVQYRTKRGKTYEVESLASSLSLHFSLDAASDGPPSWHVEASSVEASSPPPVDGWGATPAEALKDVVRAWTARRPLLAGLDWEAVTRVLHEVRAV